MTNKFWGWLSAPRNSTNLVVLRIGFGLMVAISAARFLAYGWVDELFLRPKFQFTYPGLDFVRVLPPVLMHALFVTLVVCGVLLALGLAYRFAAAFTALTYAYLQAVDITNYLNHYYLVALLAGLLVFIPANATLSLDAWIWPSLRRPFAANWCTMLLRLQVAVVYVFAGLAKLTGDWLLHAQPLSVWLRARTSLPVIGPWLGSPWVAYAASWGGFLFDTTIVIFLLWRRTRLMAYLVVVGFHAATAALFPIGMFPVIMTVSALVFFDFGGAPLASAHPTPVRRWRLAVGLGYAAIQILLPLRTHLYPGNVLWHEQGMRFSWRVMAREKNGSVNFLVTRLRDHRTFEISARQTLTPLQEREMAVQPDLILQFAQHLARGFEARGDGPVEVRVEAFASLNGRPPVVLIDPTVDLVRQRDSLQPKTWIKPAPQGLPLSAARWATVWP